MTQPVKHPVVPLHIQADCAKRELVMRHRVYPGLVKRGKMTAAEMAGEIAAMRALRDLAQLCHRFEKAIRDTIRRELAAEKLADHPAVRELRAAFPEAEIADIRFDTPAHPAGSPPGESDAPNVKLFMGQAPEHDAALEGNAPASAVEGPAP